MEKVELKAYGTAYIVIIDGEPKLRRNSDGTWSSAEVGWGVVPSPLHDTRTDKTCQGWTLVRPDGSYLDHVFGLNADGTGFLCAIGERRRVS